MVFLLLFQLEGYLTCISLIFYPTSIYIPLCSFCLAFSLPPQSSLHRRSWLCTAFRCYIPAHRRRIWSHRQASWGGPNDSSRYQIRICYARIAGAYRARIRARRHAHFRTCKGAPVRVEDHSEDHNEKRPQGNIDRLILLDVSIFWSCDQLVDYDRFNNSLTKLRDKKDKSLSDEKNLFKVCRLSQVDNFILISSKAWTRLWNRHKWIWIYQQCVETGFPSLHDAYDPVHWSFV